MMMMMLMMMMQSAVKTLGDANDYNGRKKENTQTTLIINLFT